MRRNEKLVKRVLDALERMGESTAEDVALELNESVVHVYDALKEAYDDSKVVRHAVEFYTSDDGIEWDVLTWEPFASYFARDPRAAASSCRSGARS